MTPDPKQFAIEVAKEAGDILMSFYGKKLTKDIKTGPNDFATEADVAAEKIILERILGVFPEDSTVAEESGVKISTESEYTWIIDPLDGTHNFAEGTEEFGVLISRLKNGVPQIGVAHNPIKNLLAVAGKGDGTYINGTKVILSTKNISERPVITQKSQEKVQIFGKTHSMWSAIGDAFSTLQNNDKGHVATSGYIWDFAAPALLITEAGWKVTGINGEPFCWNGKLDYGNPGIVAAPPDLHQNLLDTLTK